MQPIDDASAHGAPLDGSHPALQGKPERPGKVAPEPPPDSPAAPCPSDVQPCPSGASAL